MSRAKVAEVEKKRKRKEEPESTKEAHQKKPKTIKAVEEKPKKSNKEVKRPLVRAPSPDESSSESSGDDSDEGIDINAESEDGEDEDIDMDEEDGEGEDVYMDGEEDTRTKNGIHPDRAKKVEASSTSSREAHAKQKQLIAERKATKPLAEQLARAKKLWERLRRKSHVPIEERKELIKELFEIITGNVKDYVLKHDSVRVIQTAIKYANLEQKKMIANELKGSYRQLAESKYAKFLIGKLLVEGDEEVRDTIVPEFFGYVRKLIKHPEASWILDDVYRGIATKNQKATIIREWYGAEFALFGSDSKEEITGDLSAILEKKPEKREPIMRSLLELMNGLIQKKFTAFTLLHDAMLQYFLNAKKGSDEIKDFLELIKGDEEGDLLKNLAFTKSGARVVCLALAYGTAKDRKQILRQFKDSLQVMAGDLNAHIVILAAYEVIDDTVLTSKSIFPELLSKDTEKQVENIVNSAVDLNARTTLLYLFEGRTSSLFPASMSSDLNVLKEIDIIRTTTSKKDPEIRRAELAKALSPMLLRGISAAAGDLVADSFGCHFLTQVLLGADGDKSEALTAVAATASGDPSVLPTTDAKGVNVPGHLANSPFYGKLLKSLIAGGFYNREKKRVIPVVPALDFADILYPVIKEHVAAWATSSGSFVILNLLEAETFQQKEELKKTLKKHQKELLLASTEETAEQKLKKMASEEKSKGKSKKKIVTAKAVGNMGSKFILEKL